MHGYLKYKSYHGLEAKLKAKKKKRKVHFKGEFVAVKQHML